MEQTQHCFHSFMEVHEGHINLFRAMVKFSIRKGLYFLQKKLPVPHYIMTAGES